MSNMAVIALTAPWATSEPGYCQMYAREVAERVGSVVGLTMDHYRTGTANGTWDAFRPTRFAVWNRHEGKPMPIIQEGDFLYKDGADAGFWAGHVGIAVNGRHVGDSGDRGDLIVVCENSHYHTTHPDKPGHNHNADGAKGWRSLSAFGQFTGIVRLT